MLLQAELEEAKTKENEQLKSALQEVQLQFEETKDMLKKEREAARVVEKNSATDEVSSGDHERINKLTAENEELKVRVC